MTPQEAQGIVQAAQKPYPEYRGDGKWLVIGQGTDGRFIQVIYVLHADDMIFIIHARPLTHREKRRRRRKK